MILESDWLSEALCKGKHDAFWYPPVDSSIAPHTAIGKLVCEQCTVWESCLDAGIDENWGVWGGLSPLERDAMNGVPGAFLSAHGTWVRWRQGCRCGSCRSAKETQKPRINLELLANVGEELEHPSVIRRRFPK